MYTSTFLPRRGLSPRVRGNRTCAALACTAQRSIPARAGEPMVELRMSHLTWVYPRACGGTILEPVGADQAGGLSPRVRGKQGVQHMDTHPIRSIPARAGEPSPTVTLRSRRSVYPRACGGTYQHRATGINAIGLSPRVRGNP